MQIPILNGIKGDWRRYYPVNMVPVPLGTGISNGYFKPADGIRSFATAVHFDRGGVAWRGSLYRLSGYHLVKIASDGTVTPDPLAIPGAEDTSFAVGNDRIAFTADKGLYYYDGYSITKVTDPDLGDAIDVIWLDGYFVTTDGSYIVTTELTDPTSIKPLKYGSAEASPDKIVALKKIRNEAYVVGENTIEVFDNMGGEYFPLQRIEGAQVQKGCVGTRACCVYLDTIAMVGQGVNESPSVYMCINASALKVSTHEIDTIIQGYSKAQLAEVLVESRNDRSSQLLYIHLPNETLVYDHSVSQAVGEPVWFILSSSVDGVGQYRAKNFVWCYDKWICGDKIDGHVGYLTEDVGSQYGTHVHWEFQTDIVYNGSRGAIFHELELVALTGDVALGDNPTLATCYSNDGYTWSDPKFRSAGKIGDRAKRIVWYRNGSMRDRRIQKFFGDSSAHLSFARLEAQMEPLYA